MKHKLLISFSGGETSAYMTWWIWNNWQDKYHIVVVFANTGDENEETLRFVARFGAHFGIPIVWVEALVFQGERKGTSCRVVCFDNASRNGEPFENVVRKYGIPNKYAPHCTRELKQKPISAYAKAVFGKDYYLAIGIREDEIDRMNAKKAELKILYPLVKDRPMTKQKINFWWSQQPFRLELKGYQGNCKACHKKSDRKLITIAKETPSAFDVFRRLESSYDHFMPDTRIALMASRGEQPSFPIRFYRGNKSVSDFIEMAKSFDQMAEDDSVNFDESEACEVFSECGIDNEPSPSPHREGELNN